MRLNTLDVRFEVRFESQQCKKVMTLTAAAARPRFSGLAAAPPPSAGAFVASAGILMPCCWALRRAACRRVCEPHQTHTSTRIETGGQAQTFVTGNKGRGHLIRFVNAQATHTHTHTHTHTLARARAQNTKCARTHTAHEVRTHTQHTVGVSSLQVGFPQRPDLRFKRVVRIWRTQQRLKAYEDLGYCQCRRPTPSHSSTIDHPSTWRSFQAK